MKKLIIAIITMLTLIPTAAFAANQPATLANNFHVYYNGIGQHSRDANDNIVPLAPIVIGGTTYLPVRTVSGLAGLNVDWDATTKTVKLSKGGTVVEHRGEAIKSSKQITVDTNQNFTITLDGKVQNVPAPFIYNGTTYLPVRAICDMVGIPVEWRSDTKTILLGTYLHEASPSAIIPADAKVLTDKDMIELAHKYNDGSFFIESDGGNNPNTQLDFKNDGYKTVTFTVTTDDVWDKSNQNVEVNELDSSLGSGIATVPQAYGQTKTYSADISGHSKIGISVGVGGNSNAIVSNIYLTK